MEEVIKIKKNRKSGGRFFRSNFDYFLIFVLYFIPHLFMGFNLWDDILYKTYFEAYHYNVLHFISRQYQYWTSRVVIEAAVIVFGWLPPIIWMLIDTLMIVLLYHSMFCILKLFLVKYELDSKYRICQMFLFLSFPYALMATAGWLTTTISWAWMLSLFVYGLKGLLYSASGQKQTKSIVKNIIFCLAYVYATNFDVAAIIMFCLLMVVGFACHKSSPYEFCLEYWEGLLITIGNLVLFFVCPGNRVRMEQDAIIHGTADVLELSVLGKIRMGINSAFYHYMSIPNAVLFTICMIMLYVVWVRSKSALIKSIAFLPVGITVIWTVYIFFAYTVKNHTLTYVYPDAAFHTCPRTEQYLAMVSALMLVLSMVYLLYYVIREKDLFVSMVVVLLIWGLLPDIVLGFTSTISASILRVVSFLYLAFIFISCVVIGYSEMLKNRMVWKGIIFLGSAGTVLNFVQMIRHIIVYG